MARFGGLFKKGPRKEDSEPEERKPRTRRTIGEEESTVSEALEEIEAEEEIPEAENIEDELIQLEGEAGLASEETSLAIFNQITEKLNDIDAKMSRFDNVTNMMKNDSTQFQEQLGQMEEDMRKLLSVYEVVSARFNPFIDMKEEEGAIPEPSPRPAKPSKMEEEEAELMAELGPDELPPFRPFGSKQAGSAPSQGKLIGRESAESGTPWEPKLSTFGMERPGSQITEPPEEAQSFERFKTESPLGREPPTVKGKMPILVHINHDYLTLVLVMRWIEFLFERTTRDKISLVLDYYKDIGWICEDVKSEIMAYARGEMQDVTKYMAHEEAKEIVTSELPPTIGFKKVDDWRLTADDHLKSLLFIMKIANINVDKDRLNSLEQMIQKFKEDLEGFHGV